MVTQSKNKKLDKLLSDWIPAAVYTSSYLKEKGYTPDLLNGYKESGWMRSIGTGAYTRFNDEPSWEGGLYALQQQLKLPVHVGGITALLLQGYGHFLPPKLNQCHLYSSRKLRLPKWFRTYNWDVDIILHISSLFGSTESGLTQINRNLIPIKVASPERAILEMLSHVDSEASFTNAWQVMEGLTTLRPQLMQTLLERCTSIKVVRLCLYMGEKSQLQWVRKIDKDKLNLGSGKRSIVKGGKLNQRYQITVPEDLENDTWT